MSRHQLPTEKTSSQKYISATGDVQQPSQGLWKVGGCIPHRLAPRQKALMAQRAEVAWSLPMPPDLRTVFVTSQSLPYLFRALCFIRKLLTTEDWSRKSLFSTLVNGTHPSHHTISFGGILVTLVKWRQETDDKVLLQLSSYSNA